MSGYEKQDWASTYAAPQGQGGYQQQPPHQIQQVWNQQPYGQQQGGYPAQQGGYQAPSSYTAPPGYGAPPQGPYDSPQPQQRYGAPPHPQGQYGAPPQQQWGGAPPLGPPGGPEKRHSVCFKFSGTKQTILNSQVMDPYGKVPFNVVSDKKHTTVSAADGTTLAVMDWNHSAPVMHYGGKKLQCREWIKLDKSKKCVLRYFRSPSRSPSDALVPFLYLARFVGFVSSPTLARNITGSHATKRSTYVSFTCPPSEASADMLAT
jgi:hypothetical protein